MFTLHEVAQKHRTITQGILPDLVLRWSPRSMTGEALTRADLQPLFEAARWAPSSYNNQPWRFHYALRDTPGFKKLFALLMEANQAWCKNAACLMVAVSKTTFDFNGQPMRTHSHDTGAAWHAMAIEGVRRNLLVHGMSGFDYDAAAQALALDDGFAVECMIAVGRPAEGIEQETVNDRKSVDEIAIEVS